MKKYIYVFIVATNAIPGSESVEAQKLAPPVSIHNSLPSRVTFIDQNRVVRRSLDGGATWLMKQAEDSNSLYYKNRVLSLTTFTNLEGIKYLSYDQGLTFYRLPVPTNSPLRLIPSENLQLVLYVDHKTLTIECIAERSMICKLSIKSIEGDFIETHQVAAADGLQQFVFSLDHLAAGSYLCNVQVGAKYGSSIISLVR